MSSEIKLSESIVFADVINELRRLHNFEGSCEDEQKWVEQLTQLALDHSEVSSFAHEYDYSPSLKYNGARAYLKMVTAYFVQISQALGQLKSDPRNKETRTKMDVLRGQCFAFSTMSHLMKRTHQNRLTNDANSSQFCQEAADIYNRGLAESSPEKLLPFYNPKYFTPWFPRWMRFFLRIMTIFVFLFSNPLLSSLLKLTNANVNSYYTNYAINFTIEGWSKPLTKGMDNIFYKLYVWLLNLRYWDIKMSTLTLDKRQSEWFIDADGKKIGRNDNRLADAKPTKCLFVKPRNFTGDNVLFHIHGGAFISFTAESYQTVLLATAKATGAAIVSIEYTLSPEAKYPVALQECLDLYLNLVSSDPIIGFKPKKIFFMGDSAGGYFSVATSIAVAEIRQIQMSTHETLTRLPDAIFACYPISSLCFGCFWPSRCLFDVILPPSCLFSISNAYSGPVDEKNYHKERQCIWYKDELAVEQFVSQVNGRFDDPFVHLISYKHFDRLQDVHLYIQAGEFDPIFDDSIALARRWKGPVTWDILEDESHGWMTFEIYVPKLFPGLKMMAKRIMKELQGKSDANVFNNNHAPNGVNGFSDQLN